MAFVGIETEIIILACVFGFIMAGGIGANDVANAFGTSVGSGAISLKTSILLKTNFLPFAPASIIGIPNPSDFDNRHKHFAFSYKKSSS